MLDSNWATSAKCPEVGGIIWYLVSVGSASPPWRRLSPVALNKYDTYCDKYIFERTQK